MPFLLWAAIRRSVGGVSLCLAIVAMFSIVGALNDLGPFAAQPAESAARALQAFLLVGASSLMLLAASLAELEQERALAQRNTERLNLALRAARMGTWEWDIALNQITYRSRSANGLASGIRSHTQAFPELLDRVRVEDRHLLLQVAQRAAEGSSCEVEFRLRRGGGKVCWISSRGKVIPDSTGRARRMIGVYTDTTLRKSQDTQLHSQREQIARLNKASLLGELSAALAHELRQPLTAILSNAEAAHNMLTTTSDRQSAEVREILADIIGQDERAATIIDRLRALFVRGEPKSSAVDSNECIRQVLAMEASYLTARNVSSSMGLDSAAPAALIDPIELQQVLINLIVNACDAMEHNAPADRFFQIRSAAHDGGVMIEIDNSGPTIADCEQVFEPFFTTKPDGLGLGLAICRTVIGAYQGRLWATSRAPRGATFHIWLPKAGNA
jgi:C4-dicarboxylate-specific signal transduction histidine kinase